MCCTGSLASGGDWRSDRDDQVYPDVARRARRHVTNPGQTPTSGNTILKTAVVLAIVIVAYWTVANGLERLEPPPTTTTSTTAPESTTSSEGTTTTSLLETTTSLVGTTTTASG